MTPHNAKPSVSGSMMSSTMRSGVAFFACVSADAPSAPWATSNPSNSRLSFRTFASAGSSSTMRIRLLIRLRDGQADADRRAFSGRARNVEHAVVIRDDALHDGESEAAASRSARAAAKELPRHLMELVARNAAAAIGDVQDHVPVAPLGGDRQR